MVWYKMQTDSTPGRRFSPPQILEMLRFPGIVSLLLSLHIALVDADCTQSQGPRTVAANPPGIEVKPADFWCGDGWRESCGDQPRLRTHSYLTSSDLCNLFHYNCARNGYYCVRAW